MKKQTVKFENMGLGHYKSTDRVFEIKPASYKKYHILKNGEYMSMSHTANEAKEIIRTHVELYM